MEYVEEAVSLIQYIKFSKIIDPVFYRDKASSKHRQLCFAYRKIREKWPDFAGLRVIEEFLVEKSDVSNQNEKIHRIRSYLPMKAHDPLQRYNKIFSTLSCKDSFSLPKVFSTK